jgi:hypothetical protein
MKKKFTALVGIAVALSTAGIMAAASSQSSSVDPTKLVIRHVPVGCHVWSLGVESPQATHYLVLRQGQSFTVENRDNSGHKLVQLSGPTTAPMVNAATDVASSGLMMSLQPGVRVALDKVGTYVFSTSEDHALAYGAESDNRFGFAKLGSVGPDNTLTLTVRVIPDRNHRID